MSAATRLARRLGVPVTRKDQHGDSPHPWSGRALHLRSENESNLIHDLAHYQVSAPSRRRLPTFGEIPQEEPLASLLGIAWEYHLRGWSAARSTLDEHNWISRWDITERRAWDKFFGFMENAMELEAMGFLRFGKPTTKLRGRRERLRLASNGEQ